MEAAAPHLTPVTQELGGESLCIVEPDVDGPVAARRIAWGKFFNAGQTCAAPDYAYVHRAILGPFVEELSQAIRDFYGNDIEHTENYARIVNDRSFARLGSYLDQGEVVFGGECNRESRFFSPTLITRPRMGCRLMEEEIFGPIFPILVYDNLDWVIKDINRRPKPLSLYLFTLDEAKQAEYWAGRPPAASRSKTRWCMAPRRRCLSAEWGTVGSARTMARRRSTRSRTTRAW